ncbi:unnamed protein product [Prunus armeniaca]
MMLLTTSHSFAKKKKDGLGRQGLFPEQKLTAVFCMLTWGCSADATDEYCIFSESIALESLRKFCCAVEAVYGQWYLRSPNPADLYKLLHKASSRGFPCMLGSLDCMHWEWNNCPSSCANQFTGHKKKPTVVLEAVALYDTWIWHAFFGATGSNNDINILARSPLFNDVVYGVAHHVEYIINGNQYHLGYYLADGIYPRWATLVKTISSPDNPKNRLFAQMQEAYRKDVERAFGILQAR